jgi:hypothetical protein
MTNSAGLAGATPINIMNRPLSRSACVIVVLSQRTKIQDGFLLIVALELQFIDPKNYVICWILVNSAVGITPSINSGDMATRRNQQWHSGDRIGNP